MSSNSPARNPIIILFSYAHEDEKMRDDLEKHLSSLKRQERIECWHDRKIVAGAKWGEAISTYLDKANIILLLISKDFIASDYCNTVELKRALERHKKGEVRVIPVILRPCDWGDEPFAELQAVPKDAKPIVDWPNPDTALLDVARGIKRVVEELEKTQNPTP
jgi:hypothetical protein